MIDPSLSWIQGADGPPLLQLTIGQALDAAAARWGAADAIVSCAQSVRWTWQELLLRADAMAAGLLALGLVPGDRLSIWSPNCAEWALTQFAAAKVGLILTTINPAFRATELEFTLNAVAANAIITADRHKTTDYAAIADAINAPTVRHRIKIGGSARAGWIPFQEIPNFASEQHRQSARSIATQLDCNDPVNIQFTSGTTGKPKGATLSHRNILNNGRFVGLAQHLVPGDRICIPVPLFHCFGLVMGNLAGVTCGATVVYPSPAFDAEATLRAIAAERCTSLYGVPTMFVAELGQLDKGDYDLSSLRTGVMAGSPCPIAVMKQVCDRMHMTEVTIAYGMTETSPVSLQSAPDDPIERRISTVGRVQPHLEVKIIDEQGRVTPRGTAGELCTRGYSVMLGYWHNPAQTAEVIDADGWMHTGDLATLDVEGYANIVGRIKDMVIRGGENIYPREIEEFLFTHPQVAEVQVVGVPDERMGEELCAWIRLIDGALCTPEEIHAFCRGRIAHYKVPRHIRFVTAFPLTTTGKVKKFEIREQMMAELGVAATRTA